MSITTQQITADFSRTKTRLSMSRALSLLLLSWLLLGLSACVDKELIGGLKAKQAVEILVVLNRAGIQAEKQAEGRGNHDHDDHPPTYKFWQAYDTQHTHFPLCWPGENDGQSCRIETA